MMCVDGPAGLISTERRLGLPLSNQVFGERERSFSIVRTAMLSTVRSSMQRMRFGPIALTGVELLHWKTGLKQDGAVVDQETRVNFFTSIARAERNAIFVQAGSA